MGAEPMRPYHVLLVEDDHGDALLIEEVLEAGDPPPSLARAENGVQALEYLRDAGRARPDLIVLDLNMPLMGGAQLLDEVKRDELLRRIPVVVLTTSASPEHVEAAYRSHAAAYVVKPGSLDTFNAAVRGIDDFFHHVATRLPDRSGETDDSGRADWR